MYARCPGTVVRLPVTDDGERHAAAFLAFRVPDRHGS
jgi:hypothetical protein